MPPDDIVHAFLRRLAQWAPPAEVQRAELEFRQQWGGANLYIKKSPLEVKTCPAVARGLAAGMSIREAASNAGVSLRHAYRVSGLRLRRW